MASSAPWYVAITADLNPNNANKQHRRLVQCVYLCGLFFIQNIAGKKKLVIRPPSDPPTDIIGQMLGKTIATSTVVCQE